VRKEVGFTLVEVLVGLLVFTVGLLSTIAVMVSSARFFQEGHSTVRAVARAEELLERERSSVCAGTPSGLLTNGELTYRWQAEQVGDALRHVTVVISSGRLRARLDTLSKTFVC